MRGEVGAIIACEAEWRRLASEHIAIIMVGNLNVHHPRWLRHSAGVFVEGTSLCRFCCVNCLKQFVKRSDAQRWTFIGFGPLIHQRSVEITHEISDQNMALACFDIGIAESTLAIRKVFDYAMADWALRLEIH